MKIPINIKTGSVVKEEKKEVIVGIDLGTTNSLVAYISNGEAVAVKDADGRNTLVPSIIHFGKERIEVGNEAKKRLISHPERTIYSVKRLMGKSYDDTESVQSLLAYTLIDEGEDKLVKIKVDDKYYSPIELSAKILAHLKQRIEKELGSIVSKAVITVPAYFNDSQRQATRDAGKIAGLDVMRIVNEPTAASLAYGIGLKSDESAKIAVYDLGGGTFDISILEIEGGVFEVLSTNGNTFLGGDDIDRAVIDYWIEKNKIADQITNNKAFLAEIRVKAEAAKKHLSSNDNYEDSIEEMKLSLSKNKFQELTLSLIEETLSHCAIALKDAELEKTDIDHIIMVGGSTRIPLVKQLVSNFFGKQVNDSLNPDEVVALGAAIQADILAGNRKDVLLLDITPLSLGIETVGGLMDVIIPRNSKVPSRQARNYTTSVDGQTKLKVSIYQGERDLVVDNRKLGEFILKGIPPMGAGIPKIQVQFGLDADGILTVKALEERSKTESRIEIRSQYGISEEEMGRMLIESIQNAEKDMKIKALIESKTEAQSIVLSTEKFITQNQTYLSELEVVTLKDLNKELKNTIVKEDKDSIEKAMETLNKYSAPIAHKMLDINIANTLQGKKL